jgi:predicted nucleic acid-binding protein
MTPTLLDTDTLSFFNKQPPTVIANAARYRTQFGQLIFSELSYYEVTRGLKAAGATARLGRFEQFCLAHRILPFMHAAATAAADIWADLRRRGLPIGEIDTLLAGVALSEGLALATHNTTHFNRIAGLTVVDWTV